MHWPNVFVFTSFPLAGYFSLTASNRSFCQCTCTGLWTSLTKSIYIAWSSRGNVSLDLCWMLTSRMLLGIKIPTLLSWRGPRSWLASPPLLLRSILFAYLRSQLPHQDLPNLASFYPLDKAFQVCQIHWQALLGMKLHSHFPEWDDIYWPFADAWKSCILNAWVQEVFTQCNKFEFFPCLFLAFSISQSSSIYSVPDPSPSCALCSLGSRVHCPTLWGVLLEVLLQPICYSQTQRGHLPNSEPQSHKCLKLF